MQKLVIHAVWCDAALHLWAERLFKPGEVEREPGLRAPAASADFAAGPARHALAAEGEEILGVLHEHGVDGALTQSAKIQIALPAAVLLDAEGRAISSALASPRAAHAVGHSQGDEAGVVSLVTFEVPTLRIAPAGAMNFLSAIDRASDPGEAGGSAGADDESELTTGEGAARTETGEAVAGVVGGSGGGGVGVATETLLVGEDCEYFVLLARYVRWLLAQQRVVPMALQEGTGLLRGLWQVWPADDASAARLRVLIEIMPPSARAGVDALGSLAWPVVEDFLMRVADAACRAALTSQTMEETIEGRDEGADSHVAWLTGLLADQPQLRCSADKRPDLLRKVRGWVGSLQERGPSSQWRLCFRLEEPIDLSGLHDLETPGPGLVWQLTLALQSLDDPSLTIDAQEIWLLPSDSAMVDTHRIDKPQELLLSELARAARLFKPLETALGQSEPTTLSLTTNQAYEFLREVKPLLVEQGYGVHAPHWWESPQSRLGVRLRIDSDAHSLAGASPAAAVSRVGLGTLVNYHWQVSLGDTSLSLPEFEKLASMRSPLVMIGGRWVEIRAEDIQSAVKFIRENPGGEMELGKAIRLAYAADTKQTGLPVLGMDVTGWAAAIFGDPSQNQQLPMLTAPEGFVGSLRPYQLKGLSWLSFLDRFGLGTCLADDMGLGKTIQFLAMLLHERDALAELARTGGTDNGAGIPGPTLLIVPMSVVGNWLRESGRFAPQLRVMVHHGLERAKGEVLLGKALKNDLVITTYALAYRDREHLDPIPWRRIALDEAQNIKNPQAKQTQAIRSLDAPRRVALTGTPIENRLSELWSIMDFLNPGLLGTLHEFRTRFAVPIERYRDSVKAKRLRAIVQPFVLRRLKTDPAVIADLPEKVETKDFCYLTPEQASLYEATVKTMLATAESSEGIQRRGVILAGLVKLKQICNHPHLFLKGKSVDEPVADAVIAPARSGKCARLVEMLDEVVSSGGQALVFTQFRQMGILLANMLRHELDRDVLLLHGGTTAAQRDQIVASFQKGDAKHPILVLSLKAGGVGLNLTAANHVFHFDRWWNPAVESQATDRAYRIGQTRTVQVHKFVVAGTLEERIDQMIEQKQDLAANVIGSGETWLTELSLNQLRDVLTLRADAVEQDEYEPISVTVSAANSGMSAADLSAAAAELAVEAAAMSDEEGLA